MISASKGNSVLLPTDSGPLLGYRTLGGFLQQETCLGPKGPLNNISLSGGGGTGKACAQRMTEARLQLRGTQACGLLNNRA